MSEKSPVTVREIIRRELLIAMGISRINLIETQCDQCIMKIKQKLAHLRRVLFQQLEIEKQLKPAETHMNEILPTSQPLSTDEILDIVYTELDHMIEGLDEDKKDLKDLSKSL